MLVGGLEHDFFMNFHILGMSSSQLTHIFQRGRYTTNQIVICVSQTMVIGVMFTNLAIDTGWCPSSLAKLVYKCNFTMVKLVIYRTC